MKKIKSGNIVTNILFVIVSAITLFPVITLFLTSFKTFEQIMVDPISLIPDPWTAEGYRTFFIEFPFLKYLGNTLFLVVVGVVGTVFSSSLAAYGFMRFDVKHKKYIFNAMLAMIMVPGTVLQIPIYELYIKLHWIDTYYPFTIPSFLGGGFINIFLLRQFMLGIPREYFEAQEIDGANEVRMYATLAIPLSAPVVISICIFTLTGIWNDFFQPLMYLTDEDMYTLGYGLYIFFDRFKIENTRAWNIISAASLFISFPIILLYFFTQKYFVQGLNVGGLKG